MYAQNTHHKIPAIKLFPESTHSTVTNQTSSLYASSIYAPIRNPSPQLLQPIIPKYRQCKPNANTTLSPIKKNSINFLPEVFCKMFTFNEKSKSECEDSKDKQVQNSGPVYIHCSCDRTEDNHCELILRWIDEQYYWKTDRQFIQVYQHYNRKKNQMLIQDISNRLKDKLDILGATLHAQKLKNLANVISNYLKHLKYYNRYNELIGDCEVYLWVALGIMYHMDLQEEDQIEPYNQLQEQFIFWAMDIIMNKFGSLSEATISRQANIVMGHIQHYFPQWYQLFMNSLTHPLSFQKIVREWVSEMMFGYMGIECIGFYLNSFRKIGWSYLHKVILSYFQMRVGKIKSLESFMNGEMNGQMLAEKLIDSQEQWPIVFCTASAFKNV